MIKIFEDYKDYLSKNEGRKYWIIKNDQYANVRLFKIGMPLNVINKLKVTGNKNIDKFFVGYNQYNGTQEINKWSYANYQYSDNHPLYDEQYDYMGYVNINNNDIDEYESRITSKKYNL